MSQPICPGHSTCDHLDDAPFADERERYLRHCAEHGATPGSRLSGLWRSLGAARHSTVITCTRYLPHRIPGTTFTAAAHMF
jgi:hypothetical protein